jgi:antitoxin component YwqK of YwqJK toxin-antitoxin module
MENLIRFFASIFQGLQGSYIFNLFKKAFIRLRTAVMNPFRRVVRRVQQVFNVNLITAKLVTPINKKMRKILSDEAKSPEDYFTIGHFWISKMLVYVLILAGCAAVFIYFNWFAAPVSDVTQSESQITSVYYDYDDMDLGEFTGKANIRAANGNVVYTGDIVSGVCTGTGTLWSQNGTLVYEGGFENNSYSGSGTLYYSNGKPEYVGEFADNTFSGQGILYYTDGSIQYEGEFSNGVFSGTGVLYDEKGVMIYSGDFQSGSRHGSGISYYSSGIKKYEGEFYMGKAQGQGILYSSAGKKLFEGQFARDDIHYEALLGCTLEEVMNMFQESPVVYFSDGETSLLFERSQIILKVDCLVELKIGSTSTSSTDGWYLPDDDGETLTETEDSQLEETTDTSEELSETESELADLPVNNIYHIYYYLSTDEWQTQEDLDLSAVNVTAVTTYRSGVDLSFLSGEDATPENGGAALQECVAIEKVRQTKPTAFSTISYEMSTMNRNYISVSGINMAESIYEEVYELDDVSYRLCYQMDDPDERMFVTYENN